MTAWDVWRMVAIVYGSTALFVFGLGIGGAIRTPARIARLVVVALVWPLLYWETTK